MGTLDPHAALRQSLLGLGWTVDLGLLFFLQTVNPSGTRVLGSLNPTQWAFCKCLCLSDGMQEGKYLKGHFRERWIESPMAGAGE